MLSTRGIEKATKINSGKLNQVPNKSTDELVSPLNFPNQNMNRKKKKRFFADDNVAYRAHIIGLVTPTTLQPIALISDSFACVMCTTL